MCKLAKEFVCEFAKSGVKHSSDDIEYPTGITDARWIFNCCKCILFSKNPFEVIGVVGLYAAHHGKKEFAKYAWGFACKFATSMCEVCLDFFCEMAKNSVRDCP